MDSIEQEQTYEIKYIFLNHPVYARARAHTHTPPHTHTHTHTSVSEMHTHFNTEYLRRAQCGTKI